MLISSCKPGIYRFLVYNKLVDKLFSFAHNAQEKWTTNLLTGFYTGYKQIIYIVIQAYFWICAMKDLIILSNSASSARSLLIFS